ncbi:MAG TPA: hypothetical protein VF801_12075 [Rhodocyclaceae bacterium]
MPEPVPTPKRRLRLKAWQWAVIALAVFTFVSWLVHRPDARARQLNQAIAEKASPQLRAYPYEFHVLRTEGSVAVMATPRNFDVPAFRMIGALFPDIDVRNPNDPAFVAAQKTLGEVQAEARTIVLSQPGIKDVRWELDTRWLAAHAIEVPAR